MLLTRLKKCICKKVNIVLQSYCGVKLFFCLLDVKLICSMFDFGGPGFDSHPGWHFSEALISLLSDNGLQVFKAYYCNIIVTLL